MVRPCRLKVGEAEGDGDYDGKAECEAGEDYGFAREGGLDGPEEVDGGGEEEEFG